MLKLNEVIITLRANQQAVAAGIIVGSIVLTFYFYQLLQSFNFAQFFAFYLPVYTWVSIVLLAALAALVGLNVIVIAIQLRRGSLAQVPLQISAVLLAFFLGALSADCPRCSAFLAKASGQLGANFAIFPWHGLEAKLVAILMLFWASYQGLKILSATANLAQTKNWTAVLAATVLFLAFIITATLPDVMAGRSFFGVLQNPAAAPASCVFR